jgi:putative glutathione S-transferase
VPVLYDEKENRIVSNESSEIIEMLNSAFDKWSTRPKLDLHPPHLQKKIDEVNEIIYPHINDGVYRCGFAGTQEAYENAYHAHWEAMDDVEARLGKTRFLCSDTEVTLADVRLFVTLVRYDAIYVSHFKTGRNRIKDMKNMDRYFRDLWRIPEFKACTNLEACKFHYHDSQRMVNPTGIVPVGPVQNWEHTKGLHKEPYNFAYYDSV